MKRVILLLVLALTFTACAGKTLDTVISLEPKVADGIRNVQLAVMDQKAGLEAVNCGQDSQTPPQPVNCYIALQTFIGQISTYNVALADATQALNTTSAKTAIANMITPVENWIMSGILKLPAKVQPFVLVGLEALRTTLLVMQNSLGG